MFYFNYYKVMTHVYLQGNSQSELLAGIALEACRVTMGLYYVYRLIMQIL